MVMKSFAFYGIAVIALCILPINVFAEDFGQISVTIGPQDAVNLGAKWRLWNSDTWQDSGTILSDVPVGDYIIIFKDVPGYYKSSSRFIEVTVNQTYNLSATYLQDGNVITVDSLDDTEAYDGKVTLREALSAAWLNSENYDAPAGSSTGVDKIVFDPSLSYGTINLSGSKLDIYSDVIIEGLGVNQLTIDAGGLSQVLSASGGYINIKNLTIKGGQQYIGAGISGRQCTLVLENCKFTDNYAAYTSGIFISGGALDFGYGELIVKDCDFTKNRSYNDGGAIYIESNSRAVFESCYIHGNTAGENDFGSGGGIGVSGLYGHSSVDIINSVISCNSASFGGAAIFQDNTKINIINSTIASNVGDHPSISGDGIYNLCDDLTLTNTIVALNGTEINNLSSNPINAYNCLISDATGSGIGAGNNNILGTTASPVDPLFEENPFSGADGLWGTSDDDYGILWLTSASPAKDAGDNSKAVDVDGNLLTEDLLGNSRIYNSTVDMGAIELQNTVNIPDLTGASTNEAEEILNFYGLNLGTDTDGYSVTVPVGKISDQSPISGSSAAKGSNINIVLSIGPAVQGQGTEADPFIIDTTDDLVEFSQQENAYRYWQPGTYTSLEADLDLTGIDVTPIGIDGSTGYNGTFKGNGHTISHLTINTPSGNNVALFGYLGPGSKVNNLILNDVNIAGDFYVGSLCGGNDGGSILDCSAENINIQGNYYVGGLVGINQRHPDSSGQWFSGRIIGGHATGQVSGFNYVGGLTGYNTSTIRKSYSNTIVSGSSYVGGLVGMNEWASSSDTTVAPGSIIYCYSEGTVTGQLNSIGGLAGESSGNVRLSYSTANVSGDTEVGGLVGWNTTDRISDCYATGDVSGRDNVGGLIGTSGVDYGNGTAYGRIERCYSAGLVQGTEDIGGLIGYKEFGSVDECFWDTQTSGQSLSDGGEGKSTTEMQDPAIYANANWNFSKPMWLIQGTNYPVLSVWSAPDTDDDGQVDFNDLLNLSENWLITNNFICNGVDFTGDRSVNLKDFAVLANHWLEPEKVSNHIFEIEISTYIDYEYPTVTQTEYGFEMYITTDSKVENILFMTPAGNVFELFNTPYTETSDENGWFECGWEYEADDVRSGEGVYEWWYEVGFYDQTSLDAYGDGEYIFAFIYDNGRINYTSVDFYVPGTTTPIIQPTQRPTFTSFNHGDVLSSPVNFVWQACTESEVDVISLDVEKIDADEDLELLFNPSATSTSQPLDFEVGLWEAELYFVNWHSSQNADGIAVELGKYTESDSQFEILGEISDHVSSVDIEMGVDYRSASDESDTTYDFGLYASTSSRVDSIEVSTPAGNSFVVYNTGYTYTATTDGWIETNYYYDAESGLYEWDYEQSFDNIAGLDFYGDGNYTITVHYANGQSHQTTVWFGIPGTADPIPQPLQKPVYTSFSDGDTLSSPVTFSWQQCTDPNANYIWFDLESDDGWDDVEIDFDTNVTQLDQPLALNPGTWRSNLGFATYYVTTNNDGISIDVAKYSENDYQITIQ